MMWQGFIEAESEEASLNDWLTDVRDVARAHVLAAETPSAKGRYIVSQTHTHSNQELYAALAARFPQYGFPRRQPEEAKLLFDTSKVD